MTNTEKLFNLMKENPTLPVIFRIDSSEVVAYDFCWCFGSPGNCDIEEFAVLKEDFYDDKEDFKDAFYYENEEEINKMFPLEFPAKNRNDLEMKEVEAYLDKVANKFFKKAIIVTVKPYEYDEEE